jgi:two-component system chemotaxis response regulator CheY
MRSNSDLIAFVEDIRMCRLLIVDDAMIMRKLIRDVATSVGWEVAGEAANGEEAIRLYESLKPDLVTMDLVMPIMGGNDALRAIRASDPEARVVVVTALDQKETLMESIGSGAMDFIVKPFDRDRIVNLLNKVRDRLEALGRQQNAPVEPS